MRNSDCGFIIGKNLILIVRYIILLPKEWTHKRKNSHYISMIR
ncbi:hypothetical protein D1AOALGA4SA_1780 [Olavius algarvensis Delta 1 endosymbiont]|nr:hypothetical protein D1AOALGA4SA_1780 [Olavius algarvensis Delta 1 endosymbiont]